MIRHATLRDSERILEIYAPYIVKTPASFETDVPSLQGFTDRIRDTQAKFPWLVYETEGSIAGYAYAGAHRSRSAYEWSVESTVYVDSTHHRKGIGKHLYRVLLKVLKAQGAVNVFAGITQPNEASVRLHESLGFAPIGQFKDIGFKLGKWWDVGWWQLQLQKLEQPMPLATPRADL